MESKNSSNLVKFLLDLSSFEKAFHKLKLNTTNSCKNCKNKTLDSDQRDFCDCLTTYYEGNSYSKKFKVKNVFQFIYKIKQ